VYRLLHNHLQWPVACCLALLCVHSSTVYQPSLNLPEVQIKIAGVPLRVDVASTYEAWERGLSFRPNLISGRAMLFSFDETAILTFSMRNTWFPLSIGFFDEQCRLLNIEQMSVGSKTIYRSVQPARYAIEVNSGWFEKNGISAKQNNVMLTPCVFN